MVWSRLWHVGLGLLRLALAALFLMSGFVKLADPYAFRAAVAGYGLFTEYTAAVIVWVLPVLETLVGLTLLTGKWRRGGVLVGACLLIGFLVAMGAVVVRGTRVECGCGVLGGLVSWITLARNLVLLGLLLGLSRCRSWPLSVDDWWERRANVGRSVVQAGV